MFAHQSPALDPESPGRASDARYQTTPKTNPQQLSIELVHREQWRPVRGRECCYEVSDHGRVRRIADAKKSIKPCIKSLRTKRGYLRVKLTIDHTRTKLPVHILVLEAFRGLRPPGTQTRHLNGISTDNRLVNLAWGSAAENAADRIRHGTVPRDSRNGSAKLREADIPRIRAACASGAKMTALARQYGVHWNTIGDILRGKNWAHI